MSKTTLQIKVIPNSSSNKISEKLLDEKGQEYYKIHVTAIAEDSKANKELIKFLAKHFKTSKSKINILRGKTTKMKLVEIIEE